MLAYHFITPDLMTSYDHLQAVVGEWLEISGTPKLCKRGLHASIHPWDALTYAKHRQTTLCLVELEGDIQTGEDKVCAKRRRVIKTIDAHPLFHCIVLFVAKEMLSSFENQFPNDSRVRECIETTELYLRGEATKKDLIVAADDARSAACISHAIDSRTAFRAARIAYTVARDVINNTIYAAPDASGFVTYAIYTTPYVYRITIVQHIRDEFQRLVNEAFSKS